MLTVAITIVAVLVIQLLGILIQWGARRPEGVQDLIDMTLWWPFVPLAIPLVALERAGVWLRWRGPLTGPSDRMAISEEDSIWWEARLGPVFWGHWYRPSGSGSALGRWVGIGKPGGRGICIGRTWSLE